MKLFYLCGGGGWFARGGGGGVGVGRDVGGIAGLQLEAWMADCHQVFGAAHRAG